MILIVAHFFSSFPFVDPFFVFDGIQWEYSQKDTEGDDIWDWGDIGHM